MCHQFARAAALGIGASGIRFDKRPGRHVGITMRYRYRLGKVEYHDSIMFLDDPPGVPDTLIPLSLGMAMGVGIWRPLSII